VIQLSSKLSVSFSPDDVEGLEGAAPAELREVEISGSGFGVHFPAIKADVYVPGLLGGTGVQSVDSLAVRATWRRVAEQK